jgi:hypothetical protein
VINAQYNISPREFGPDTVSKDKDKEGAKENADSTSP